MLDQSIKGKDQIRINELQRSLLELQRETDSFTCKEFLNNDEFEETETGNKSFSLISNDYNYHEEIAFTEKETEYLKKVIKQNIKQYDEQINIVILGNKGVGKTSLMNSMLKSNNPLKTKHTIG